MKVEKGNSVTTNQLAQLHGSEWVGKQQRIEMTEEHNAGGGWHIKGDGGGRERGFEMIVRSL